MILDRLTDWDMWVIAGMISALAGWVLCVNAPFTDPPTDAGLAAAGLVCQLYALALLLIAHRAPRWLTA